MSGVDLDRELDLLAQGKAVGIGSLDVFMDRDLCTFHLCGLCPFHALGGSRGGPKRTCHLRHNDQLRQMYLDLPPELKEELGFESDWIHMLRHELDVLDQHIAEELQHLGQQVDTPPSISGARLAEGESRYTIARRQGISGDISGCIAGLRAADALRPTAKGTPVISSLCDVCGSSLNACDSDQRLRDHFEGRVHSVYRRMRAIVAAYKHLQ